MKKKLVKVADKIFISSIILSIYIFHKNKKCKEGKVSKWLVCIEKNYLIKKCWPQIPENAKHMTEIIFLINCLTLEDEITDQQRRMKYVV